MELTSDPRDQWSHARRIELVRYAHELGHTDIIEQMPKELIVKRLKGLGVPPPNVPPRPLIAPGGDYNPKAGNTTPNSHRSGQAIAKTSDDVPVVDADDLLEMEYRAAHKPVDKMTWNEMRAEVKARGMKLDRKWNMADVRKILGGQ